MRLPSAGLGLLCMGLIIGLEHLSSIGLYRSIGITPWNPSAGLSVALTFVLGAGFSPYIMLAYVASFFLGMEVKANAIYCIMSISPGAIYIAAGIVMQRWTNFDPGLGRVQDCLRLMVLAAVTASLGAASQIAGLAMSDLLPSGQAFAIAWRSCVGTAVGILTVTPLVLLACHQRSWPRFDLEQLAQLATVLVAAFVIFGYPHAVAYQLFYLMFLPVLWVALRYGIVGAIVVLNLCQIAVIAGAQLRFGPLPGLAPLQTLLVVLVVTGLLVGAVVTERQSSSQRIREQHAALNRALRLRSAGETAAAIAHEISQPITALGAYCGIIKTALARGELELARETADKLQRQCERAGQVVSSIRELIRHGRLVQEPVDLSVLLDGLVELHRAELPAKGVALQVDVPRGFPQLLIDPTQMQQALHNLINNSIEAIESSGRRGTVNIAARLDTDSSAVIEVRDNGPGFPRDFAELASTPFLTTKKNGSGLGLAVARSVAEAHGGSLIIVPTSHGATVRLKIPFATEEPCAAQ